MAVVMVVAMMVMMMIMVLMMMVVMMVIMIVTVTKIWWPYSRNNCPKGLTGNSLACLHLLKTQIPVPSPRS